MSETPMVLGGARSRQISILPCTLVLGLAWGAASHAGSPNATAFLSASLPSWILLLSAVVWAGGILYLALVRLSSTKEHSGTLSAMLRFSPLALAALGVLLITGIFSADLAIIRSGQAFGTAWGRGLTAILALAAGCLFLGLLYVWQLRRRLAADPNAVNTRMVRRWLFIEALAAVFVVALTAIVLFGGISHDILLGQTSPAQGDHEPLERGLTLAGEADPLFVLLHSVPNRAGNNRLAVTVVDWQNPESLYETNVRLHLENERETRDVSLVPEGELVEMPSGNMGRTFSAPSEVWLGGGGWNVVVALQRPGEPITHAEFSLPVAENPGLILERADEALRQVRSVRMVESLSGAGVPIKSEYEFMTPDRMHIKMDSGFERIVIGHAMYERGANESWRERRWPSPDPYAFPMFSYVDIASEATLLGVEAIDGQPHYRVHFVHEPTGTFYEVWTDVEDYRTRRLTMMAPAHYMYWDYYDYDAPDIQVVPPES